MPRGSYGKDTGFSGRVERVRIPYGVLTYIALSSNGRTAASDAVNRGSSPCRAAFSEWRNWQTRRIQVPVS
jgi:hypothetical protein